MLSIFSMEMHSTFNRYYNWLISQFYSNIVGSLGRRNIFDQAKVVVPHLVFSQVIVSNMKSVSRNKKGFCASLCYQTIGYRQNRKSKTQWIFWTSKVTVLVMHYPLKWFILYDMPHIICSIQKWTVKKLVSESTDSKNIFIIQTHYVFKNGPSKVIFGPFSLIIWSSWTINLDCLWVWQTVREFLVSLRKRISVRVCRWRWFSIFI